METLTSLVYPLHNVTVIFAIVDQFSKAAYIIALSKLPSARETADTGSDRGPQFTSRLEGVLSGTGSVSQPILGVPSPVQWSDNQSGCRSSPMVPVSLQSHLLVYPSSLGNSLTLPQA